MPSLHGESLKIILTGPLSKINLLRKSFTFPRMMSKILLAVSKVVGKTVKMVDLINVKNYWQILTDLGSGRTKTDIFDFKAVSL